MNPMLWTPINIQQTRMWQFMQWVAQKTQLKLSDYETLYHYSIQHSAEFWQMLSEFFDIQFKEPPTCILNKHTRMIDAMWFQGATLNFAEHLLRCQEDKPALVSIDELGRRTCVTYSDLHKHVAAFAAGLKRTGVRPHDRVAGIMPNVAATIIAMLATTSLGAIWSSCSPDFGANAIIDRLSQIEPKVVVICDGHTYLGKPHPSSEKIQALITHLPTLKAMVIYSHLPTSASCPHAKNIIHWDDFLVPNQPLTFVPMPFNHPVYILFSSGTTGQPKCIVHGAGGTLLQHVKELGLHCDLGPKDNLLFYTTCGWMMWNWMVSGLALGATLTLYEGAPNYPSCMRLFEWLEAEHVTVLGISAKYISTLAKDKISPQQYYRLKTLRLILSTGSPLLPEHFDYVAQHIKSSIPLSSISGGTDIVSCFALANPMVPVYSGEIQSIGLGMAVAIFDEQGQSVIEQQGELVCTQAFPSMPVCFWNDPDKKHYHSTYFETFPDIWTHGDYAEITSHHSMIIYGRSDATLKPGGVRIGTAEIYRQIATMPEILDSVAVGQNYAGDVRVILFVKLADNVHLDEALKEKICLNIKQGASPRHVPAVILAVPDIPHTLNGKLVETAVRQIVNGWPIKNKDAIANPEALTYFKDRIELKESRPADKAAGRRNLNGQ